MAIKLMKNPAGRPDRLRDAGWDGAATRYGHTPSRNREEHPYRS